MIVPIIHENDADGGGVPIFRNAPAAEIERLRAAVVGADLALWEDVLGPIIDTAGIERTGQDGPKRVFQFVDEIRGEIERLRTENERLRSLIGEWAYSADERAIHLRSGDLSESIDKRHYDACEALVKAVGFPRLARQEFETDDLRRDLPA